jgi:hypothetical protein
MMILPQSGLQTEYIDIEDPASRIAASLRAGEQKVGIG